MEKMEKYGQLHPAEVDSAYKAAKAVYTAYGVDVDAALHTMENLSLSVHCWQGDDITGFEEGAGGASGGILATGNYPYKAKTGAQLRADLEQVMAITPGKQRINMHSFYAEPEGETVDRDKLETRHFSQWIDWAKKLGICLDFNPSCFGHPMAKDDMTLASPDEAVRRFWIDHVKACRKIAYDMGKAQGSPCIHNIWIPDGSKDMTADRMKYRKLLISSLDEIFEEKYDPRYLLDAVECKLFGIGSESYVVGSHEFYLGYLGYAKQSINPDLLLTLDMGHFHPTENVADKITSILAFHDRMQMHLSRGVRWDSDHVTITADELSEVMREIKRSDAFSRVFLSLDFFDGSINRVAALTIGARAVLKAALGALLEPTQLLKRAEQNGDLTSRLILMDEFRTLPVSAVWNKFCLTHGVPAGSGWIEDVRRYEETELKKRD